MSNLSERFFGKLPPLETAAVHTFPVLPEVVLTPREAFFAEKKSFRLEKLLVLLVLSRWCFILLEFPLLLPGKNHGREL